MMKAVIDTNVLVSALLSSNESAATVLVVSMVLEGYVAPILTDDILKEYGEVLRRKKFKFPEQDVGILLSEIKRRAVMVSPVHSHLDIPDKQDLPFLEAMLADKNAVLITGNIKHFPDDERILTPRGFLTRCF